MGFLDDIIYGRKREEEEVERLVQSGLTRKQAVLLVRKHFEGKSKHYSIIDPLELISWFTLGTLLILGFGMAWKLYELRKSEKHSF